jgi:hypothetical protein
MPTGKYTAQDLQGQYSSSDVDEPASARLMEEDARAKGTPYAQPLGGTATIRAIPEWYSLEGLKERAIHARNWLINQLPTAGGIGGGIIGGGVGLESGPGDIAAAAIGSAAGGALGEDAREALFEKLYPMQKKMEPKESAEAIGKSAAVQGFSELLPRMVGRIFRPASTAEKLSWVGKLGPREDIDAGLPEILKTEREPGNKVETIGQYLKVLDQTKRRLGNEVSIALRNPVEVTASDHEILLSTKKIPLAAVEADTTSISDRIRSIEAEHPTWEERYPEKLKAVKARALSFERKPHTYGWLFAQRQELNDTLAPFYKLASEGEKAEYLDRHPEFAIDKAEADAIRDLIYPQMDKAAGKPEGYFRDLQRRYGSVISVDNATNKHVEALMASARMKRGAPFTERVNVSTYGVPPGRVGMAVHRLHGLVFPPEGETVLNRAVKGAFGHSAVTGAGKVVSAPLTSEILALPIRVLLEPDEIPPVGPKTRKLQQIRDNYAATP